MIKNFEYGRNNTSFSLNFDISSISIFNFFEVIINRIFLNESDKKFSAIFLSLVADQKLRFVKTLPSMIFLSINSKKNNNNDYNNIIFYS